MVQEPETPPENADEWSDQQWIDWLNSTDGGTTSNEESAKTVGRIAHSPSGRVLGNAMIGLARALYGPQDEKPAIVVESGEPDTDQPVEVHLDFDHPDQSFVVLRPDSEPTE